MIAHEQITRNVPPDPASLRHLFPVYISSPCSVFGRPGGHPGKSVPARQARARTWRSDNLLAHQGTRLQTLHPGGAPRPVHERNVVLIDGKGNTNIYLGLNEPEGTWTLQGRGIATGARAKTNL